jgi:hypothetical protein
MRLEALAGSLTYILPETLIESQGTPPKHKAERSILSLGPLSVFAFYSPRTAMLRRCQLPT